MDLLIKQECVSSTTTVRQNEISQDFNQNQNMEPSSLKTSQDTFPSQNLDLLKTQMHLEIKSDPDTAEDDGLKTPPVPKKNPINLTLLSHPARDVQHHHELKNADDNASTAHVGAESSGQGYLHEIYAGRQIRELENMLEEAQYNFQMQKRRSISAVSVLNQSLKFLQNNIQEILNIKGDAATEGLDIDDKENRTRKSVCYRSIGTDPIVIPDMETEVRCLETRLTSLEENTAQKFKQLEMKRQEMLKEIKRKNAELSELLEKNLHHDTLILPTGDLNLQEDWIENRSESSVDMGDYEIVISQVGPEAFKNDTKNCSKESPATALSVNCDERDVQDDQSNAITSLAAPKSPSIHLSILHKRANKRPGFICTCGEKYKASINLWNHIAQQSPPCFECDHCENEYHSSDELNSHKQSQHNLLLDDKLCCKTCQKTFLSRSEIIRHKGICPLLLSTKERTTKRARLSASLNEA